MGITLHPGYSEAGLRERGPLARILQYIDGNVVWDISILSSPLPLVSPRKRKGVGRKPLTGGRAEHRRNGKLRASACATDRLGKPSSSFTLLCPPTALTSSLPGKGRTLPPPKAFLVPLFLLTVAREDHKSLSVVVVSFLPFATQTAIL